MRERDRESHRERQRSEREKWKSRGDLTTNAVRIDKNIIKTKYDNNKTDEVVQNLC